MKADNNKVEKLIFAIFLAFGIVFFTIGISLALVLGNENKNDYVGVMASIDEIEKWGDNHHVYVSYFYEGEEYSHVKYNRWNSGMREGQIIGVMINPNNPTKFYTGNFGTIFGLSFGGFGLVFGLIGAIPLIIIHKKRKAEEKLRSTGISYWGTIVNVWQNRSVSYNGRHPYKLDVKYEDESIITTNRFFTSKNVWFQDNPDSYIGKQIRIFVDPNNMDKYLVDIESVGSDYGYGM